MSACDARYKRLGCASGILYLGGSVLGMFVSIWLCEVATITLMHPPGGYFVDGLRYAAGSKAKWLTNGEAVPGLLFFLNIPLYLLLMCGWQVGSLFAISGVAQRLSGKMQGSVH